MIVINMSESSKELLKAIDNTMKAKIVKGRAMLLDEGRLKDATWWTDEKVLKYYKKREKDKYMNEKRLFVPRITEDLVERAKAWIGKVVTVERWHENVAMKLNYPKDKLVGYVLEFHADIPESELHEVGSE